MPQIKAAKRAAAISKLNKVETRLREAEEILNSFTAEEMEEIGFSDDRKAREDASINAIYRVFAHAGALRIVREHLRTELRQ